MVELVLITRTEPGASRLAGQLQSQGYETIKSPLLEIRQRPLPPVNTEGMQALLITSRHALAASDAYKHLPLLVVGSATAEAAKAQGFNVMLCAPDATQLTTEISSELNPSAGTVLYLSGNCISMDFPHTLPDFTFQHEVVYDAMPLPLSEEACAALKQETITDILLMSAHTARNFCADLQRLSLTDRLTNIRLHCLSPTIAKQVDTLPCKAVLTAADPTEAELLKLLVRDR